jgi:hypothetical protein
MIGGQQDIAVLNDFAEKLSEMSEYEHVLFTGALEITDARSIESCDEILHNLDCFELTPNLGDYESLGREVAATQFANLPSDVLEHLDYEQLGKMTHGDDMSVFVRGHRVIQIEPQFDERKPASDPLKGYTLKMRLVSDANPDGVWIKFPLYESEPGGDVERGEEIQVALAALKAASLSSCRAAECVCEYPSLNRCVETHADMKLNNLVWMARNFAYAESELSQYGVDVYEKLRAALELEDCGNLDFAAGITQNLRCYDFGRDSEAIAEEYLMMCNVNPILTSCFDRKSLGEKLVADHGMVQTANGLIAHNGNEFVFDYYEPPQQQTEQPYKEIRFLCPLKVQTDPDSELAAEYGEFSETFDMVDLPGFDHRLYEDKIRAAIDREHMPDEEGRGLAEYLREESGLVGKVTYIWPSVEAIEDGLYGVIDVKLSQELSPGEYVELTDYITGQMSDGWGESFEQHPIRTDKIGRAHV